MDCTITKTETLLSTARQGTGEKLEIGFNYVGAHRHQIFANISYAHSAIMWSNTPSWYHHLFIVSLVH